MNFIHTNGKPMDPALTGNKAKRLSVLSAAGFRVPHFFVISPVAFQHSLDAQNDKTSGGHPESCSNLLCQKIETALAQSFPDGAPVAVRSSSTEEDGEDNSFAGQFASFLNIDHRDVCAHVVAVWKSGTAEHIDSYRKSQGIAGDFSAPAVLVQKMVDAETAGVAFAADPITGDRNIAIVAAGRGLGDKLVSGEEQGDTWRVTPGGKIESSELEDESNPVLSKRKIRRIATLARKVSKHCGKPQDIEWAIKGNKVYLLQSRDITTLEHVSQGEHYALWDNSNIVESYGGVTTPLTFSVARSAYADAYRYLGRVIGVSEHQIRSNEKTYEQLIGLIDGRVYYNLLNWYRLLMLTPGFRFNRRFMEQMMGVTRSLPDHAVPKPQGDSLFASVRSILGMLRVSWRLTTRLVFHNHQVRRFFQKMKNVLAPVNLKSKTLGQLVDYYESLQSSVIPAWDVPLLNDLYCMIFHGALRKLCEAWLPADQSGIHNNLVSGESGIISLEPVRRMRAMAEVVRSDSGFVTILNSAPVETIRAEIAVRPEFKNEFDDYLELFGDRCMDELKLESPTVADDPLSILRSIGQMAKMNTTPNEIGGEAGLREEAEKIVHCALGKKPIRRFLFGKVLNLARSRVRDRENLRFERTRVYGRVRAVFVEIGRRLQEKKIIAAVDDIFYFEASEVIRFVQGTGSSLALGGIAELRREEFGRYRSMTNPPRRFVTCGPAQLAESRREIESDIADNNTSCRIGQACSRGLVRGPVRIVRDPRSANVRAGEILVAERTDPGWVTIFPLVTGMVMERGSLLSHSAIVARELGLPCVVGVENACDWLTDGEWIEIDGSSGSIRRLAADEMAA